MTSNANQEVPTEISRNLRKWDWMARGLRFVQVILGAAGTASALVMASFTAEIGTFWVKACSFIAAFCIGMLAAFDISGKANATRQACRLLRRAILRYRYVDGSSLDKLIESYSQAQELVGGVSFRQLQNSDSHQEP